MSKILTYILPILVVGCAGMEVYDPPEDANSPTIMFEGENSLLLLYRNGDDCSEGVGIPEMYAPWTPNHRALPVRPDVVTSFQVRKYGVTVDSADFATGTCGGIFSFSPKRSTDYVFLFEEREQGCSVVFLEKDRTMERSTFSGSQIRRREEKFAMTTRGSVCSD